MQVWCVSLGTEHVCARVRKWWLHYILQLKMWHAALAAEPHQGFRDLSWGFVFEDEFICTLGLCIVCTKMDQHLP